MAYLDEEEQEHDFSSMDAIAILSEDLYDQLTTTVEGFVARFRPECDHNEHHVEFFAAVLDAVEDLHVAYLAKILAQGGSSPDNFPFAAAAKSHEKRVRVTHALITCGDDKGAFH